VIATSEVLVGVDADLLAQLEHAVLTDTQPGATD
jgi:hypothetical protein